MWAELKIQEDSLVMAHRRLSFPQQLCSILPGVSCDPPTTASRNQTHGTFPKLLWELLWVETPGTVESKIFTGTTKIPCSRATPTAKWAAEVKTRCCSVIYFQHVHVQRWEALLVPPCIAAASWARSHETLNCAKATAIAWEEDWQPWAPDTALMTLLPVGIIHLFYNIHPQQGGDSAPHQKSIT